MPFKLKRGDAPSESSLLKGRLGGLRLGRKEKVEVTGKVDTKPLASKSVSPAAPVPAAAVALAPAPPPAAGSPDPAVEAQLKKLGDQMAKLAQSVETSRNESKEVGGKLAGIEENMRSLMSLSEALSNMFNPMAATFQEGPPVPAAAAPNPGTGATATAPAMTTSAPAPPSNSGPMPGGQPTPVLSESAASGTSPSSPPASSPGPVVAPAATLPPSSHEDPDFASMIAERYAVQLPTTPALKPATLAPSLLHGPVPEPLLADLPPEPEAALAALAWLDQLAIYTGTEGARRLLAYYEDIGWIGPKAHVRLLSLAAGLPARAPPEQAVPALDLHAASFANLERLCSGRAGEALLRLPRTPGSALPG
jgi:flagellar protein/flagellar accessory protein C (FlaC)